MANYSGTNGREYRPAQYVASPHQRDAAFSSIFGARPPPGRTQTMSMENGAGGMQEGAPVDGPPRSNTMQFQPGYSPGMTNGYTSPPSQRPMQTSPVAMSPSSQQGYPQQQYPPQQLRNGGRPPPHGMPQRIDPRAMGPGQYGNRPLPNRGPGMAPGSMMDGYRSQSLATTQRPAFQGPSVVPPTHNVAPQHTFRQPIHQGHAASRTTAQGRIVPERPDERTMSLTTYARDAEYSQTMSGRVIPNRRKDASLPGDFQPDHSPSTSISAAPGNKTRSVSQDSTPSRTMSMASTVGAASEFSDATTLRPSVSHQNSDGQQSVMVHQKKQPLVYPALLSRVADCFEDRIVVSEKDKDGLVYTAVFTGAEAVDLICYIIRTNDRNLALLLGRALDAQKFFHDVTYNHRLRDSQSELYRFREALVEDQAEVNGVFTLLTECYSPTCTRDRLCYSIACPRRLEQQARLNLKSTPGLKREESKSSLHEEQGDEQKLWINTVSQEVADSVSDKEKKRQEVISELMYTERDFVKDLDYLDDFWIKPLRSSNPASPSPIPEHRREKFVRIVFNNCMEIRGVNSRLAEALTRRQQAGPVVRNIGDIFMDWVPRFGPFITYGAGQLFGKYEFEKEKSHNLAFSHFVDEVERMKESRKLELNGYLTKPTTRLARYPLLLENVLKYTADDNPDKDDIPKAIATIKDFLSQVNVASGQAENHFNLMQLNQQLQFRPGEYVDLKLTEENRQLVFKGTLRKTATDTTGDITTYLFDHAILLVRVKQVNKQKESYKVYKKPIPLELLVITQMDEVLPKAGNIKRPSSSLLPGATRTNTANPKADPKQVGYPITFKRLGKDEYETTLFATTHVQRRKWIEHIEAQQTKLRNRSAIFSQSTVNEGYFSAGIKVNCCVPIDGGRKLVIGTDYGVFVMDRKPKDASAKPRRVLEYKSVTQIDVLEQHSVLLVLSDKTLYSFSMEALEAEDNNNMAAVKRGRKICHAIFFKVGVCQSQHLVCCVKTSTLSSTIKVYEPMDSTPRGKKKTGFSRMLAGGQDVLKPYKEFYIPSDSNSIHFLKSKLCVGCARGFEVVSLETLETQSLLDQADTSLDFVARKENIKPIHIERLASEFLLCYSDFSFFVNRNGWRARPDWKIVWEGNPQAFAIFSPYILAFEPSFIEIRHMETAALVAVLVGKQIRMLHSSTREILYAHEDEMGEDVICSLDFWARQPSDGNNKQG